MQIESSKLWHQVFESLNNAVADGHKHAMQHCTLDELIEHLQHYDADLQQFTTIQLKPIVDKWAMMYLFAVNLVDIRLKDGTILEMKTHASN